MRTNGTWRIGVIVVALQVVVSTAAASDFFFEAWPSNTGGPPYPTDLVDVGVYRDVSGTMVETCRIKAALSDASYVPAVGGKAPEKLHSYHSSQYSVDSFFDVFTELSLGDFPGTSFRYNFFEAWPSSAGPGIEQAVPTLNFAVDSFFDITYEIDFVDGTSALLNITGTPGPGLIFTDVHIEDPSIDSFFDVFTELTVNDAPVLALDSEPLVHMTMTGTFVPEPTTLGLLCLGGWAVIRRRKK